MGSLGRIRKHVIKVIGIMTNSSGADIVLSLGTWAGTSRGGIDKLRQHGNHDSQQDSFTQLVDSFGLELEAEEYQDRVRNSKLVSHSNSPAPQSTAQEDEQILAQVRRLLEQTSDSREMRDIFISRLNQTEGFLMEFASRSFTGLEQLLLRRFRMACLTAESG